MKASFGFTLLIVGILGIAKHRVDASPQNLDQMIGAGPGIAWFVTLTAAFLLVGGLLILARTGRFSVEGSRGHAGQDAGNPAPSLSAADAQAANENT